MWGRSLSSLSIAGILCSLISCGSGDPSPSPTPDAGAITSDAGGQDASVVTAEVTLVVTVPETTEDGDVVYVAGDFQGWMPGDPTYALTQTAPLEHQISLTFPVGTELRFKFTRGDWTKVEKGQRGEEIADRTLTAREDVTARFTVRTWADATLPPASVVGDVRRVTVPEFLRARSVWVYLPPSYETDASARFPVLYMLDGQNIFDIQTSFSGEWRVDETLERLIPAGDVEPMIVVAVANSAERIDEYTPWRDPEYQGQPLGGGGEAHLVAIRDVLKPYIDRTFRTRTGPEDTGFAGSSLGGLMSVYAAYAHANTFGRIGALSPSVWWHDRALVDFVRDQPKPNVRMWVDMGTSEGGLADLRALQAELLADGFIEGDDLRVVEVAGGTHNEGAWAARIDDILRFLYPR